MLQTRRSLSRQISRTFGNMVSRRTFLTTFFNDVLQDLTIERQICHEAFEACVFLAQLAQLSDLGRTEAAKAFTPGVERRFGNAELAGDVGDRRAGFDLAQCGGDLLVGVAGLAQRRPSYRGKFAAICQLSVA